MFQSSSYPHKRLTSGINFQYRIWTCRVRVSDMYNFSLHFLKSFGISLQKIAVIKSCENM